MLYMTFMNILAVLVLGEIRHSILQKHAHVWVIAEKVMKRSLPSLQFEIPSRKRQR